MNKIDEIDEEILPKWEKYGPLFRIKVDGGYLYQDDNGVEMSMCFVPDIDLARYQAHLRDAYKQGYETGKLDEREGRSEP